MKNIKYTALILLLFITSCGNDSKEITNDDDILIVSEIDSESDSDTLSEYVDLNKMTDNIAYSDMSNSGVDNFYETDNSVDNSTDNLMDDTIIDTETPDVDHYVCIPSCSGKNCGDDGCGGKCGDCLDGKECSTEGICKVPSECDKKGDCKDREWCNNSGSCVCQSGFTRSGDDCVSEENPPFADRTDESVCAKYKKDYPDKGTSSIPYGNSATCDPGVLGWDRIDDAVRRINLYRWLIGTSSSYAVSSKNASAQEAAMMMDVNHSLNHHPPATWKCYSSVGAGAAGSSNLGLGYHTPSSTITGYIQDIGSENTLGHRRWLFKPATGTVGIGHAGTGNATHVIGGGGYTAGGNGTKFLAYPAPGPYPVAMTGGLWSVSLTSGSFLSTVKAKVVQLSDGKEFKTETTILNIAYSQMATIKIKFVSDSGFAPSTPVVGDEYEVTITGVNVGGESEIKYRTKLINCL